MKTYVINMEKDTAKRAGIETELKSHPELNYQIWKAIEGRKLSDEEQAQMILPDFKQRYGRSASLPAAGCSLSHISIYRDIVNSDVKYALILEDDAKLSDNLKLETLIALLNTDKPVAILLTPEFWYKKSEFVEKVDDEHSIYSLYDGYMTSGYLINQSAAKLLLDYIYPVQYTADAWSIFISFGLNLYGVVPHIVSFPDGVGEIGASGNNPTTPWQIIRSKMIKVYLSILWTNKYLSGYRKSKKMWR